MDGRRNRTLKFLLHEKHFFIFMTGHILKTETMIHGVAYIFHKPQIGSVEPCTLNAHTYQMVGHVATPPPPTESYSSTPPPNTHTHTHPPSSPTRGTTRQTLAPMEMGLHSEKKHILIILCFLHWVSSNG